MFRSFRFVRGLGIDRPFLHFVRGHLSENVANLTALKMTVTVGQVFAAEIVRIFFRDSVTFVAQALMQMFGIACGPILVEIVNVPGASRQNKAESH